MKRQAKKKSPTAKNKAKRQATIAQIPSETADAKTTRRGALVKLRDYGAIGLVVGGGGWYGVSYVTNQYAEYDLDRIGNGLPAVVQIHDPSCPLCRELQRETRAALANLDSDSMQYLVADIKTDKGRSLAAAHGVGHVTLLLFDGQGNRLETLSGNNTSDYLEQAFRRHLAVSEPAAST